jgi:Tol biopolymer transport system component
MKKIIISPLILIIMLTALKSWTAPLINKSFLKKINTDGDETSCALSGNGKLFIFSRKPKGSSNFDLYYTEYKRGKWTEVKAAADINSDADEISPYLPYDGKFILFSSNRQGSLKDSSAEKPSYDIYYSERNGEG